MSDHARATGSGGEDVVQPTSAKSKSASSAVPFEHFGDTFLDMYRLVVAMARGGRSPIPKKTRDALVDLRDGLGHGGWTRCKRGWDQLHSEEKMKFMDQLGGVGGLMLNDKDDLVGISLYDCNLEGMFVRAVNPCSALTLISEGSLSQSLLDLHALEILYLRGNKIAGPVPTVTGAGFPGESLSSLKVLDLGGNKELAGNIDREFLAHCVHLDVSKCHWENMKWPFLSGASLSSSDMSSIFIHAPKAVVSKDRIQGHVKCIYPADSRYQEVTKHLEEIWQGSDKSKYETFEEWLEENNESWALWQETWLTELMKIKRGWLYVFCGSQSFRDKFENQGYMNGGKNWEGKELTGPELCKEQDFNPAFKMPEGTKALSILDWERAMIVRCAQENNLKVVFMGSFSMGRQIPRPEWYKPFDAELEAPPLKYAHGKYRTGELEAAPLWSPWNTHHVHNTPRAADDGTDHAGEIELELVQSQLSPEASANDDVLLSGQTVDIWTWKRIGFILQYFALGLICE
jgi:hypothetical protein